MRQGFLIGLGSGLASALVFFSATRGGGWLGLVLLVLTPLPPLLAGFGWGWLPALAGAMAGSLAIGIVGGSVPHAFGYFLAVGLPAAFLAYLAYLSRPSPGLKDGVEWYPVGRLLAVLALYAGALPVMVLPWIGWSYEILRDDAGRLLKALGEADPSFKEPSDEQMAQFADLVVSVAPSAMALYWLLIMTPNLYLAGRIAAASGHLGRDWPDLPGFTYPAGFSLLLGLALLAAFGPGAIGVAGASFGASLLFAHLLAGLALVHFVARRGARWLVWVVYTLLLIPLLAPYAAFLVTLAGLLEPILKLKQRLGAPQPPSL
jgi:hypothetical protein